MIKYCKMRLATSTFLFIILASLAFEAVRGNTVQMLANAGNSLAQLPLGSENEQPPKSEPPKRDDLAISRLQDKVVEVVDRVWTDISQEVSKAIIKIAEIFSHIFFCSNEKQF